MKNCFKALIASLILTGLSACANTGCNDYQAYRHASAKAPINVPSDLEQPDNESVAPEVSVKDPNTVHIGADGQCLDKPPKL